MNDHNRIFIFLSQELLLRFLIFQYLLNTVEKSFSWKDGSYELDYILIFFIFMVLLGELLAVDGLRLGFASQSSVLGKKSLFYLLSL